MFVIYFYPYQIDNFAKLIYILTFKACPMVACKKYHVQTWDLALQVGLGHALVATLAKQK
jgi:hypothetical protein